MGRFKSSTTKWALYAGVSFVVLCLVYFPASLRAADDDAPLVSTTTIEGRLAVFDDVWETILERYYDPRFRGIDWQAQRRVFRPAAARAENTHEFYEILRQMIASLKDAHTRVYSPDEKFDWWNPRFVTIGITTREVEGLPIVVHVEPNSAAARNDIRPGDVILSVDNLPVAEVVSQRLASSGLTGDSDSRYRAIATLFEGPAGTSVKIGWTTRNGKHKSAVLQRYWNQRRLGFNNQRYGKIAVLKIDAFTQTIPLELSKSLQDVLPDVQGIVLDLRANGGGDAEAMADVASIFLEDGINLGKFADRSGASFELQTFSKRLWRTPRAVATNVPLVVLTSESTSSAAEILVSALQSKGRARVIGTETCGCVLAIRNRHALPDGGVLDVSEFDYRTAAGLRLEGLGITPDDVIPLRRADIYSRRDATLEFAKIVLGNN